MVVPIGATVATIGLSCRKELCMGNSPGSVSIASLAWLTEAAEQSCLDVDGAHRGRGDMGIGNEAV